MNDNNLNKKFFTEADSPVSLLPADMAWENMQQKLDEPEEKKRRFILWILPMTLAVLTGVVAMVWWKPKTAATQQVKIENSKEPIAESRHTQHNIITKDPIHPVAGNKADSHSILIESEMRNASTGNEQQAGIEHNHTKHQKELFKPVPTLTAQHKNKRAEQDRQKSDVQLRTVTENATGGDDERSLPFSFPERVTLTEPILVQAFLPLPLFDKLPKEDSVSKAVWVDAGLQWNVPVPVNGNDHYLSGPNGNPQPWQYLLPGIWLSVNKSNQRIMLSANPFISAPLPNKYYDNGMVPLNDSMRVYGQKRMVKMFGYQASLQYGYQLTGHWWLNGGISANWWRKGLVYARSVDSINIYKPFLYSVKTKEENAITAFQLSANAALSYQFKACEALLQVNVPLTETIKNIQSPVWIRLGVRWRLVKTIVQ